MPPAVVFRSLLVFNDNHPLFGTYKVAKRVVIGVVGGTVLIMGVIMMVTPGPGIAGILLGLGILGIEFAWARMWLKRIKTKGQDVVRVLRNKKDDPPRDIS
jgi:tellurite resistance protein TerC